MWYVTMDEAWIHHYTPELNLQSAEWAAKSENRPKRPKTQMSAGKVFEMLKKRWNECITLEGDYVDD